jgi:hypothetical protein
LDIRLGCSTSITPDGVWSYKPPLQLQHPFQRSKFPKLLGTHSTLFPRFAPMNKFCSSAALSACICFCTCRFVTINQAHTLSVTGCILTLRLNKGWQRGARMRPPSKLCWFQSRCSVSALTTSLFKNSQLSMEQNQSLSGVARNTRNTRNG